MLGEMRGAIDGYLDEAKKDKGSSQMGSYKGEGSSLRSPSKVLAPGIYENSASKN